MVVLQGKASQDEFSGGLRFTADKLWDVAEIRATHAKALRLSINGQADSAKLRSLLQPHVGGKCPVAIRYQNATGVCDLRLPDDFRVKVSAPLLASLSEWLSERNVEVIY